MRQGAKDRGNDYGMRWEIASALVDGPRSREEVIDHFRAYLRWAGLFDAEYLYADNSSHDRTTGVDQVLARMVELNWVEFDGELYELTELGRQEGEKPLEELRKTGALVRRFLNPKMAALVTLVVHLMLAAIKLPAGLLSGSVGLINDAVDTLLDGVSSLMAYLGLHFGLERFVGPLLVALMLVTGSYGCYQAVHRFFVPVPPSVDWTTFAAIVMSAVVCGFLWGYQRLVGMQCGSMILITQSIDSKNHVIVAATVVAGLVAAQWDFYLLDTLVGLAVAVLILKSAIELVIEYIKAQGEAEMDLSSFRPGIARRYDAFRKRQMSDWMLFLVQQGKALTREELLTRVRDTCDYERLASLRELGLHNALDMKQYAQVCFDALISDGYLAAEPLLAVTAAGEERLQEQKRHVYRNSGRHLAEVLE